MCERRVVFWDFDGTLVERDGTWPTVLHDAVLVADPSNTVSIADLAAGLRQGFPDHGSNTMRTYRNAAAWWAAMSHTLIDACTGAGVSAPVTELAVAEVPRIYYRPASWRIIPGAFRALEMTSRAGFANVILSNHAPELPELVAVLGFAPLVERTITSASLGVEKPNPIIFRTALRLADAAPDSWMIGDNRTADVEGARAVGMRAVLVRRPVAGIPAHTLEKAAALVIRTHCGISS